MKPIFHKDRLYNGDSNKGALQSDAERRLIKIAELIAEYRPACSPTNTASGRSRFTRSIDLAFSLTRKYVPPIHWAGAAISALLFFVYARLVTLAVRLMTVGVRGWPNVPIPCVMAVWHGCAPSLLIAIVASRPRARIAIMISRDERGDFLTILCRMLGLGVVRGDGEEGGWEALSQLAREIDSGACALITADGGGPARVAKEGAIALASATGAPLIAVGADCHPAVFMRRKWDRARTPLPFGRVAITIAQPSHVPAIVDGESIEQWRRLLEGALNHATARAERCLDHRDLPK
jgi:lysophospholipid acyltransferase (LPLAT)-like uncharacterized protein